MVSPQAKGRASNVGSVRARYSLRKTSGIYRIFDCVCKRRLKRELVAFNYFVLQTKKLRPREVGCLPKVTVSGRVQHVPRLSVFSIGKPCSDNCLVLN